MLTVTCTIPFGELTLVAPRPISPARRTVVAKYSLAGSARTLLRRSTRSVVDPNGGLEATSHFSWHSLSGRVPNRVIPTLEAVNISKDNKDNADGIQPGSLGPPPALQISRSRFLKRNSLP